MQLNETKIILFYLWMWPTNITNKHKHIYKWRLQMQKSVWEFSFTRALLSGSYENIIGPFLCHEITEPKKETDKMLI